MVERITSDNVHDILSTHMQIKGYDMVFDLEKSHGMYLHDAKHNKEFLDMFSFYASYPISHNHPDMTTDDFVGEIGRVAIHNPSNSDIYTVQMAKFVDTFKRLCVPPEFKHLFFVAGGTLAVENALKVAFDWKVRRNYHKGSENETGHGVIHFKGAFHGRSGYAISLTNTADPAKYQFYPKFNWPRIMHPSVRFPLTDSNLLYIEHLERSVLADIEDILKTNGDDIACIIIEPIQGEGGDNHIRPEFWQQLRKLSDQYNVILIADEVQSGMGLTGKMWAYQHLGATPDIVCFGKKAQVCGIMVTDRIDDVDNVFVVPSRINSTWGGNLTDMVRCRKMLEIIEKYDLITNAKIVGKYVLERFNGLQQQYPDLISNIRGLGLMCAFDMPNAVSVMRLKELAYANGLLIISCGTKSIRLRPMLDVSKSDIDKMIDILILCLSELSD